MLLICVNIQIPFLCLWSRNGQCQFYIHVDSIKKMKIKIRELTSVITAGSSEYRKQRLTWYIRGWLNYFKFAGLKVG